MTVFSFSSMLLLLHSVSQCLPRSPAPALKSVLMPFAVIKFTQMQHRGSVCRFSVQVQVVGLLRMLSFNNGAGDVERPPNTTLTRH
jgi:hypothetical protein